MFASKATQSPGFTDRARLAPRLAAARHPAATALAVFMEHTSREGGETSMLWRIKGYSVREVEGRDTYCCETDTDVMSYDDNQESPTSPQSHLMIHRLQPSLHSIDYTSTSICDMLLPPA